MGAITGQWLGFQQKAGTELHTVKPGPKIPLHSLLPEEKAAVLKMPTQQRYADLSHRILAVTAWDRGLFFVSFSSVYRILRAHHLMSMRGDHRSRNGRSIPLTRTTITGPSRRVVLNISHPLTDEKGMYFYLYLVLDEYCRKTIHSLVSWHQRADEARDPLEGGLIDENTLDVFEDKRPEGNNDRGHQMKAKSIRQMFDDHHMPQLFARPRTPHDNPFVESLFGAVKTAPEYPGRFLDRDEAVDYFNGFFPWYNAEHLHSGIDYVTPEQCHRGLRENIVSERKANSKSSVC